MDNPKQTLYCPGIPGAGKTILTSIVINFLEEKPDPTVGIAYVYCSFQRCHEQRLENLLASLLKQLVQRQSSVPNSVEKLFGRHQSKGTRPTAEELSRALADVAAGFSRVFVLVDALDEYQPSDRSLDKFLGEIFSLQNSTPVSFFATSRHNPGLAVTFEGCLRQDIRAKDEDVQKYLQGHVYELPSFVSRNADLQREIIDRITQAVDGM
jgi:hypothetical protein